MIFKGWVDQSQTAIEVKSISDTGAQIKQVRAKEIESLMRSPDIDSSSQDSSRKESRNPSDTETSSSSEQLPSKSVEQTISDRANDHRKSANDFNNSELPPEPEDIAEPIKEEPIKEPEYNAWEVWTYLERQRVKTLKLLNTFETEWEANRFVREAERSVPSNLRVHYEICPILLDEAEINAAHQHSQNSDRANNSDQPDLAEEDYADAIDVEIIT